MINRTRDAACSRIRTTVRSLVVASGVDAVRQVDGEVAAAEQEVTWQRRVKQYGGRDAERYSREDEKQNSIDNHRHLINAYTDNTQVVQ